MSTRAQRRADKSTARRFERQVAGGFLTTTRIEAGADLRGHPHADLYRRAIADAAGNPGSLACIACRQSLTSRRPYKAFLLSAAEARPSIATASAICVECWTPDDLTDIELSATRVLRKIVPNGRFIDPPPLP